VSILPREAKALLQFFCH